MANIRIETEFPAFKGDDAARFRVFTATSKTARLAIDILKKTTATWEHNVRFSARSKEGGATGVRKGQGLAFIEVNVDDEIWHQIDQGTDFKLVRFSADWEAKTIPGVFDSFSGAGEVVYDGVLRPGIIPRGWSELLPDLIADDFADNVFNALRDWP